MVSFTTLATALLPLAANAYITGFTAPTTATVGTAFTATLSTGSYSQNWDDQGIVWGLALPVYDCDTCVGTQIGFTTLDGSEGLTYPYTFTEEVTVPTGTAAGDYVLKAAIPYVLGVRFFIFFFNLLFFFSLSLSFGGEGEVYFRNDGNLVRLVANIS